MEPIVSEMPRKMVMKDSRKRPEVIAVAVENTIGVLAENFKTRLSGKSHGGIGLSSENQSSDIHRRKNLSWKFDQADGEPTSATKVMEKQIEEEAEGEISKDEQLVSMLDEIASPEEVSHPLTTTTSASTWESFEVSSAVQTPKVDNIFVSEEHLNSSKHEEISTEELQPSEPKAGSRTPSKWNKWKPEEIKRLNKKGNKWKPDRFQAIKGRMVLWEEVAASLMGHGINQTPVQCKSLWESLVQKYEESQTNEKNKKVGLTLLQWTRFYQSRKAT